MAETMPARAAAEGAALPALAAEPSPPPVNAALPLPTWHLVIALALPVLGQQGLQFLVNLSDRYLAGNIPHAANLSALQAAQTTAHYLAWFINCYNVLVTVGSTALVARFIGAGDRAHASLVTHQALLLALFFAAIGTLWAL